MQFFFVNVRHWAEPETANAAQAAARRRKCFMVRFI
jgi:hypothetical protein